MSWKSVEFTLPKHILGKLVFLLALLWTPNFSPDIYIYNLIITNRDYKTW